ncbi:hypothetical protein SteCoe_3916 [Stentor coeruleus]|uniref:Uncharacterized protein n=1 Tax=Stentor coeruleus TaxID=5963 RepID=A0A1R2CW27_9CILI|nr:hypothetical protein SteCoe_3916 [Stentor coeruleus]
MSIEGIPLIPFYNEMTELFFVNSNGDFLQTKEFNQIKKLGGFAIGVLRESLIDHKGIGFIFMLCSGVSSVVALILTAAHIFIRTFRYEPISLEFFIGGESYEALPLKSNLNWADPSSHYYDPITNYPISILEVWVVCELRQKLGNIYNSKLISLNLSDPTKSIYPGLKTKLVGFPKFLNINDLHFLSSEAKISQFNKMKNAF